MLLGIYLLKYKYEIHKVIYNLISSTSTPLKVMLTINANTPQSDEVPINFITLHKYIRIDICK